MNKKGWLRIDRAIRNHWIWNDAYYLKWWLDLLMEAAWQDTEWVVGVRRFPLKRGQLVASISYLQERWAYPDKKTNKKLTPSKKTIVKFLRELETTNMIKRDTSVLPNGTTLIEIVNYAKYQDLMATYEIDRETTLETKRETTLETTLETQINNINNIYAPISHACTREEENMQRLKKYFDPTNAKSLEEILMNLHKENPSTRTMQDFKLLAWQVVSEWNVSEKKHWDYTDWANHLLSQIRIKNRIQRQNATANTNRTTNGGRNTAEQDAEFMSFIYDKLTGHSIG